MATNARAKAAQAYWAEKRASGQVSTDPDFEAELEGPPPPPPPAPAEPPTVPKAGPQPILDLFRDDSPTSPTDPAEPEFLEIVPNASAPSGERPLKQQSRAVQARWAGEAASEQDLRAFFADLPLPKAFNLYAQMRKNLELAGKILNDRSNVQEEQHCKTCGITFEDYKRGCRKNDWFLNRPYYHQGDRNIIDVDHFCSAACVSLENNKTQGVYGMPDRGMLASDNPRNHPREFPGQRSLTDAFNSRLDKKA